jgi:predicted amidohydrolase
MSRIIKIGAAQSGPIQKAEDRESVVARLLELMKRARSEDCDMVVFTELALTTFFPRHYAEDRAEMDIWFEAAMPNPATQPLFDYARDNSIGFSLGYGELTPDGQHFNTQVLVDKKGDIVGKYRKVHLPGHAEFDPERSFQHLEKRYFLPGDLGFPVWRTMGGVIGMCICNDRRWPEAYRVMGLQGVELVVLGYNTSSANSQNAEETVDDRKHHSHLCMQSGAYQNATWIVGVAKAGVEDGNHLIGDTCIIDPNGYIVAQATTEEDELVTYECDFEATKFLKDSMFNFAAHRRIEHYGLITSQTGAVPPGE